MSGKADLLPLNPHPCRACGGRTHFMMKYVDETSLVAFFHDTCVGSWLSRFPEHSLRFSPGEHSVGVDLMDALKRSLATTEPVVEEYGLKLVVEEAVWPLKPFSGLDIEE